MTTYWLLTVIDNNRKSIIFQRAWGGGGEGLGNLHCTLKQLKKKTEHATEGMG